MYPRPRVESYSKRDPVARWALTDRVFFACGACHVLAYAFLERHPNLDAQTIWIKPSEGYWGNHIFVEFGGQVFDYHGYSTRDMFLEHEFKRARHYYGTGWDATLVSLPQGVLVSELKSKTYDGLWLQEPQDFLHDALPRAHAYLDRFYISR